MITVAIGEVFYFVEFDPLSDWTGGENGLPGVPTPSLDLGFTTSTSPPAGRSIRSSPLCYFVGIVIALRIVRSPVGAVLSAIRDNPLRAAAVGHTSTATSSPPSSSPRPMPASPAACSASCRPSCRPRPSSFDTSGQLVMQTAIGGPGTLFGPLLGAAVWLSLQDFLQARAGSGQRLEAGAGRGVRAAGLLPAAWPGRRHSRTSIAWSSSAPRSTAEAPEEATADPCRTPSRCRRAIARATSTAGTILEAKGLTKRYGGLVANSDIDFTVKVGELRGIIGPNGAGKSTFFKMLTCEVPPSAGTIVFEGQRHHRQGRDRGLPARPHQELPGEPALHAADGAPEPDDRGARRPARPLPPRPVQQPGEDPGPAGAGRSTRSAWSA